MNLSMQCIAALPRPECHAGRVRPTRQDVTRSIAYRVREQFASIFVDL
jgi:hypothetical protein